MLPLACIAVHAEYYAICRLSPWEAYCVRIALGTDQYAVRRHLCRHGITPYCLHYKWNIRTCTTYALRSSYVHMEAQLNCLGTDMAAICSEIIHSHLWGRSLYHINIMVYHAYTKKLKVQFVFIVTRGVL